ncbi:MAG: helix-turn-helix domain-containing protein [Planctomycetes bacterium]|nr:helix-turn-helix domain-containing protein [Planctomycetota bacterium]
MTDRIRAPGGETPHPILLRRRALGWTQDELASRAGVPRSTVSAIEGQRLTPSVVAALALARALRLPVEQLFADGAAAPCSWAWAPPSARARFWRAEVVGRTWLYPAELTHNPTLEHDGVAPLEQPVGRGPADPSATLVLAGCDPAMGLLASCLARVSGFRVLAFQRGGAAALELLATGRVHVAALHRSTPDDSDRNARTIRARMGSPCRLLRVAEWETGIALAKHSRRRSLESCRRGIRSWAVREAGSAAHECLEELLGRPPAKGRTWRSHAAVAEAVQQGFAEAGICVRISAEEAGLPFVPVRRESLDLCFPEALEDDPRVQALIRLLGSREHRDRLRDLPGYDVTHTGDLQSVGSP